MIRCTAMVALLCLSSAAHAQLESDKLRDMSSDEYAALEEATEASVTATIAFLASDELAGRKSESKEFRIATAYVASRLRAAGARGLGPEGSFYVQSDVDVLQTPAVGATAIQGQTQLTTSLLNGAEQAMRYSGKLQVITSSREKVATPGPVAIRFTADSEGGQNAMRQLAQQTGSLRRQGVTAVLALLSDTNPLWETARRQQTQERLVASRGQLALPVLLVADDGFSETADVDLTIPPNLKHTSKMRNVCGVIDGSDPQLAHQAVLFSAHLDHLGDGGTGPDVIYNGADDDASGVTAVITLADIFGALKHKPKRSLIFTTFWGEELGLVGSTYFVADPPWPMKDIVANVNIEMIGRPAEGAENKMWMTGWAESDLGTIFAQGSRRVGVETFEHPSLSARLYKASDNYSFVKAGVVAHSFSAGSLHGDYHQVSDEWTKLNLPHMTQIIRGIYAGALSIANAQATPHGN